jgi:hypothetical protein
LEELRRHCPRRCVGATRPDECHEQCEHGRNLN